MNLQALYQPSGAAREYSPWACNLYRGCVHGCRYCYAPGCLRMPAADFHAQAEPRPGILGKLVADLNKFLPAEPVLLCFTCDPYQPVEEDYRLTRGAIRLLHAAGAPIKICTKAPARALRLDLDLLVAAKVDFGVSLSWSNDARCAVWEPRAEPVVARIEALAAAKRAGLATWLSLEPVIEPAEALAVLDRLLPLGCVDRWKIGRWNHSAEANSIDWTSFLRSALLRLERASAKYYVKADLWKYASPYERWLRERE